MTKIIPKRVFVIPEKIIHCCNDCEYKCSQPAVFGTKLYYYCLYHKGKKEDLKKSGMKHFFSPEWKEGLDAKTESLAYLEDTSIIPSWCMLEEYNGK